MTTLASNILFKVSGSIAGFKAAELVSSLAKDGHNIKVMASKNSLNFVGANTWQGITGNQVYSEQFPNSQGIDHIDLNRWADIVVLCPATAARINQMATGVSSDLLGDSYLAHDFEKPYIVFPAMNWAMLEHPTTQRSLKLLNDYGIQVEKTDSGLLACQESGSGRLLPVEKMKLIIERALGKGKNPVKKILVTAGGTSDPIDQVRNLTNTSTGQTGLALANHLYRRGSDVQLVTSRDSGFLESVKRFKTSNELYKIVLDEVRSNYDYIFMAAAISDFELPDDTRVKGKISSQDDLHIKLVPRKKLIEIIEQVKPKRTKIIAFKLTANADSEEKLKSIEKLFQYPSVEFVIHNDICEIDKAARKHTFNLFDRQLKLIHSFDTIEACSNYILNREDPPFRPKEERTTL